VGFGGYIALKQARLSLELAALGFPFGQSPTDTGRVDFRAVYAELRACPEMLHTSVSIDACALFQAGELRAKGAGFPVVDFSKSRPYLGAGAALRARIDVAGPVFLGLGLEATVPFLRDRFVVEVAGQSTEVHRVARVVGALGADLGLSF
jgi:hypothetical protein